jgi:hypothetical protein
MSVAIRSLRRPSQTHACGQLFGRDRETYLVSAWVCYQPQPVEEPQGLKHSSVDADAHSVVALFNAAKRRTAGKSSFGDYFSRQASTATGIMDIKPEFAKGSPNCG